MAAGADVTFLRPSGAGDVLDARAEQRSGRGRSGIYDVTVTRRGDVIAEFRGRSRTLGGGPAPEGLPPDRDPEEPR